MLPGIISGVSVGGIINALLPKIIIQVSYIILLGYVGYSLVKKLLFLRSQEDEKLKKVETETEMVKLEKLEIAPQINEVSQEKDENAIKLNETPLDFEKEKIKKEYGLESKEEKLARIIEYESTNFQWSKLALNWGMIIALIVLGLMRGSGTDSIIGVVKCSSMDWVLFGIL